MNNQKTESEKHKSFVEDFNEWNDVTGALPKGTSWYYECLSIVEDADEALTSQAKRYMEMIEYLEKILSLFSGRVHSVSFEKMEIDEQLHNFNLVDEALSQLAEFKKGMEGK